MLYHGAEVVVAEEDAELALLDGSRELAQPVVGQLGGRGLQELLRHQPWGEIGVGQGTETPPGTPGSRRVGGRGPLPSLTRLESLACLQVMIFSTSWL